MWVGSAGAQADPILRVETAFKEFILATSTVIDSCCSPFGILTSAGTVVLYTSSSSLRLHEHILSHVVLQRYPIVGIGVTAQTTAGNLKRHTPRRRSGPLVSFFPMHPCRLYQQQPFHTKQAVGVVKGATYKFLGASVTLEHKQHSIQGPTTTLHQCEHQHDQLPCFSPHCSASHRYIYCHHLVLYKHALLFVPILSTCDLQEGNEGKQCQDIAGSERHFFI